jgi:hypothetical protein
MYAVTGEWRKSLIEGLRTFHFSPDFTRILKARSMGHLRCAGEKVNVYTILLGRPEG